MKRQERQKHLLQKMSFVCSCDFCENDCEDERDFEFYEKILKVKNFPPPNPDVSEMIFSLLFIFGFLGPVQFMTACNLYQLFTHVCPV